MGFNVDTMFQAATQAIKDFSEQHQEEIFYAFSIDANMLCLNSVEAYEETLQYYLNHYPQSYEKEDAQQELKWNTGDWEYQGFFDLTEGFDDDLYSEHYHLPLQNETLDEDALNSLLKNSAYHQAMTLLMQKIIDSNVLNLLNKTPDFKAFLSEHSY